MGHSPGRIIFVDKVTPNIKILHNHGIYSHTQDNISNDCQHFQHAIMCSSALLMGLYLTQRSNHTAHNNNQKQCNLNWKILSDILPWASGITDNIYELPCILLNMLLVWILEFVSKIYEHQTQQEANQKISLTYYNTVLWFSPLAFYFQSKVSLSQILADATKPLCTSSVCL